MDREPEDFRSVNDFLGKLDVEELRRLNEQLAELKDMPAFEMVARLLRLDREQHSRMMSRKGQDHAEMSWEAGYVRGGATLWAVIATVEAKHRAVQAELARSTQTQDGESPS